MNLILALGFGFVAGMLFEQHKAKLGAASGAVVDAVLGARPRPASNALTMGQAAKNILAFFGGLLAWTARNPVMAIGLVLLIAFLLMGRGCSPFEFGKSRGELRLEGQLARAELRVQELERERDAEIADISRDVAVIRTQIRAVSQRGHDEIAAATPAFEAPIDASLSGAWRNSIERLRNACADQASADSCGSELAG